MLHDALNQYLSDIESILQKLEFAYVEQYEEEILAPNRVNLRIRIRMQNNDLLELNEAVIFEAGHIKQLGYRYHYQDKDNNVIFRYDNTPHFPDLTTFPHHKHTREGVISAELPLITKVIEEAITFKS